MSPRPADLVTARWEAKADELGLNALERAKSTAEKWAASLSGLTGITGIVALVKGPEDIAGLTPSFKIAVGVCLLVAVVLAFISTLTAAIAAQGVSSKIWLDSETIREKSATAVDRSNTFLGWSRGLIAPAILALLAAIGLTWFGPRVEEPPGATSAVVVRQEGGLLCGEIAGGDNGVMTFKAKDGTAIPLPGIQSLTVINSKCP